jgi:hypothetical protein
MDRLLQEMAVPGQQMAVREMTLLAAAAAAAMWVAAAAVRQIMLVKAAVAEAVEAVMFLPMLYRAQRF